MQFDRHRRLRSSKSMREMVRETHIHKEDLIYPIFVVERDNVKEEIKSMPGAVSYTHLTLPTNREV